jgi:23S rRNA (pseudouridine1915-N3)-methyltransferase
MKFYLITVGKIRESFILEGVNEYSRRIRHYTDLILFPVKEERIAKGVKESMVLQKEGKRILHAIPHDGLCVALDRMGKGMNSLEHFHFLNTHIQKGLKKIIYLIGGPLGLSREILDHSDQLLSLSPMTLTHEMSTLLLLEQIYRYHSFMAGEKYHK